MLHSHETMWSVDICCAPYIRYVYTRYSYIDSIMLLFLLLWPLIFNRDCCATRFISVHSHSVELSCFSTWRLISNISIFWWLHFIESKCVGCEQFGNTRQFSFRPFRFYFFFSSSFLFYTLSTSSCYCYCFSFDKKCKSYREMVVSSNVVDSVGWQFVISFWFFCPFIVQN